MLMTVKTIVKKKTVTKKWKPFWWKFKILWK